MHLSSEFVRVCVREDVYLLVGTQARVMDRSPDNQRLRRFLPHPQGREGAPSNPTTAAKDIIAALPASPMVESTTIAPGGFINIRLRPAFINEGIAKIIKVRSEDKACLFFSVRRTLVVCPFIARAL